jgi:hypothetical protein
MTLSQDNCIVKHGLFVDSACDGELHETFEYQPTEHFEDDTYDGKQVLSLLTIRDISWDEAQRRFVHLKHRQDEDAQLAWTLINDMANMSTIQHNIDIKHDPKSNLTDKDDNPIHWIDLYRTHQAYLRRIIQFYGQDDEQLHLLDRRFSITATARYLLNELMLEQTHPITTAQDDLWVDGYTGIDETPPQQEYLTFPEFIEIDGQQIATKQLFEADGAWSGDLTDYDNQYYDTDLEGELPSAPIAQMNDNELKVTDEYYQLVYRYQPIRRQIDRLLVETLLEIKAGDPELDLNQALDQAHQQVKDDLLLRSLAKALREEFREGTPKQDIAAFVLSLPVEIEVNGNINTVIDEFGDDILDSIVEPPGLDYQPEVLWESFCDRFHAETIRLLAETANQHSPKLHPKFVTEAFKGVAERQLPINEVYAQAYQAFRSVSPQGSTAFRQAVDEDKSRSQAMRAFYKTAQDAGEYISRDRLYRANENRVLVLTASSGYTQKRKLNWRLARYKARAGEIYIPADAPQESKKRLYQLLLSKGWARKLIAKLAQ